jgi:HEPN domain-containing protein
MAINPGEWMRQAEYDMESADCLFSGKRYFHAVFFCHLSLEKALKGIVHKKKQEDPPKVHSLTYLRELAEIEPPEEIVRYLSRLNQLSIIARYPETLYKMEATMDNIKAAVILDDGRKALSWIMKEFSR